MDERLTSLELSKKLSENGYRLEGAYYGIPLFDQSELRGKLPEGYTLDHEGIYPAYTLLWSACVKRAKEFCGIEYRKRSHQWDSRAKNHYTSSSECTEEEYKEGFAGGEMKERESFVSYGYRFKFDDYEKVFYLLQQGKKQEAEDYIKQHSIFNKE